MPSSRPRVIGPSLHGHFPGWEPLDCRSGRAIHNKPHEVPFTDLVLIAVLASGRGRYHPEILTTFQGTSGWDTAPAWLLSITMGQYCYAAIGAVTHIAEEMPQPGRRIPLVMYDRPQINVDIPLTVGSNLGVLVGVMTAVPWVTVMLCGIHDIDAVHKAFIPSMEVYYQATGSKVGATALQAFMTFLYWSKSVPFGV
ncbi:unnamed protein product [Aspergillus oryzae]|uniref:Unnamed protein product n=1 Tax=Aspergillus oryzae TaxID=5062 RepID=A0AAN5BUI5_ASPOZ|nr:unnamed protein product [Aspergillus oryzae]